jgi:hypothetical protein
LANKQYISPIRLFNHCGIDTQGELNIGRIKKQLNVEFDSTKDGLIVIDNFTYNKNDIIEELEHPLFAERMQYHNRLWDAKSILYALEENKLNFDNISAEFKSFTGDEAFDQFFSPYFAAPFNHIVRNLIVENRYADLAHWLTFEDFLLPAEKEEGYKSIRLFFEENERTFRNINKDNYYTFRPKLKYWMTSEWSQFFNALPEEFYAEKNDITVDLINLTVTIQKISRDDCKSISSRLIQLQNISPVHRETIMSNHSVFYPSGGNSSSGGNSYGWILWVVIVLLKIIVGIGSCN